MKNSLFTKNTGWNKTSYGCFIPYFFIFISKVLTQTRFSIWVSVFNTKVLTQTVFSIWVSGFHIKVLTQTRFSIWGSVFNMKVLTQTLISLWVSTSRIFILLVQTKFMDHGIWVGIFVNFSDNQVTHHRTKCIDHYICDIGTTPAAKEVVCQKLEEFNSQAN